MKVFRIIQLLVLSGIAVFSNVAFAQDPNFHVYLSFGQSNMAGAGKIEAQDLTVDSRFQFMKPQDCPAQNQFAGNWYQAVPPLWGCSGGLGPSDYFGRTMVANQPNITVGSVVVAIPGCKIELFGKTGYEGFDTYNYVPAKYNGSAYAWLLDLAKKAQQDGVIKGFLLHQGESNTGDQQWPNKVKAVYDNLITDLGLNPAQTPLLAGELLYANQGSCCQGHNSIIAKLPEILPNSYVISASGLPGQDVYHFNSAGNRTFGERYAQKMLSITPVGPTVNITSPINNAAFPLGSTITINANAAGNNSTISKVEFYQGANLLGTDNTSPYSFSWTPNTTGSYTITAKTTDNLGKTATSAPVIIKVNVPQGSYNGKVHIIPGSIQFEHYDVGGNGSAYMDDSPENTGGATFRMDEAVDIENCTDAGTGYNIGFATAGEWLEYSVDVEKSGTYSMDLRVACSGDARTLNVAMDGVTIANTIAIPNTAGWQSWQTVKVNNLNLSAGQKIMRVTIGEADYINLNYVTFTLVKELKQAPFNNTAHSIPGRIEAEEYDLGGEGLAYHEANTEGNQGNGTFRDDEVDIEVCTDAGVGFNLGYTLTGEWLEYTVNVANSADYDLELRVAKDGDGGLFHIEMDGEDLTGSVSVPNTAGWQSWQTITLNKLNLTAGEHIMRIVFESDYINLNYLEFNGLVTGVYTNNESGIKLFPNPVSDETMQLVVEGTFSYSIYDLTGAEVEQGKGMHQRTIGERLLPGCYIIQITHREGHSSKRILKY